VITTLNRLELGSPDDAASDGYKRISLDTELVDQMLTEAFLSAHDSPASSVARRWTSRCSPATRSPA
jgi:hypothetical protein